MKIAIFTLLLLSSFSIQAKETCAYFAKVTPENPYPEWQPYENCANYKGGNLKIKTTHQGSIAFGSSGLAPFWASRQYFYIKNNGDFLPVIPYDNGADSYREGFVRTMVNSKIAYYDQNFKMVIPPKYNWGWPFYNGRALVCSGCKIGEPDCDGHKPVEGGLWGYIDKAGNEVVPVKYKKHEVPE